MTYEDAHASLKEAVAFVCLNDMYPNRPLWEREVQSRRPYTYDPAHLDPNRYFMFDAGSAVHDKADPTRCFVMRAPGDWGDYYGGKELLVEAPPHPALPHRILGLAKNCCPTWGAYAMNLLLREGHARDVKDAEAKLTRALPPASRRTK